MFKRAIATLICVTFSFSNLQYVQAQDFSVNQLPVPGTMVGESVPFAPLALKGLVVNPRKPLEFQFIVDTGKGPQDTASIKDQANQLVKYFLAGLTIPEGDLWVNLSPYEKSRMVPAALGQTDLGRDLLAQDYILKQLTASLIYPEKDLGKEFWSRVYAKAQQQFGTTNVPVNTFNKVWILPDEAQVFENVNAAYVTKATLKVMLDEDYLALQKHSPSFKINSPLFYEQRRVSVNTTKEGLGEFRGSSKNTHSLASNIVRAIILPEITKEVNTGKNFAPLRQIYQSLILAKWYKETIQNGLLDAVYTNKNKIAGVNLNDPAIKEQIYERYLKAYKKGAFNYIKEDPTPDGQVVPRKYFSGGTEMVMRVQKTHDSNAMISASKLVAGELLLLTYMLGPTVNPVLAQSKAPTQQTLSAQTQKPSIEALRDAAMTTEFIKASLKEHHEILVVDDSENFIGGLKAFFARYNRLNVKYASNRQQGEKRIGEINKGGGQIGLMIIDNRMPQQKGWRAQDNVGQEWAEDLNKRYPQLPVIVMTAGLVGSPQETPMIKVVLKEKLSSYLNEALPNPAMSTPTAQSKKERNAAMTAGKAALEGNAAMLGVSKKTTRRVFIGTGAGIAAIMGGGIFRPEHQGPAGKINLLSGIFDPNKPVLLFIHGGDDDNPKATVKDIKELCEGHYNVFMFSYDYLNSFESLTNDLIQEVQDLKKRYGVTKNMTIMPYSYGAVIFRGAVLKADKDLFSDTSLIQFVPVGGGVTDFKYLPYAWILKWNLFAKQFHQVAEALNPNNNQIQEDLFGKKGDEEFNRRIGRPYYTLLANTDDERVVSAQYLRGIGSHITYIPGTTHEELPNDQQALKELRKILNLPDKAALSNTEVEPGGIDLNQINVKRNGKTVNVQFDPAQLNALEQGGFEGFTPVITGFQYIASPFLLLGINRPVKNSVLLAKA